MSFLFTPAIAKQASPDLSDRDSQTVCEIRVNLDGKTGEVKTVAERSRACRMVINEQRRTKNE